MTGFLPMCLKVLKEHELLDNWSLRAELHHGIEIAFLFSSSVNPLLTLTMKQDYSILGQPTLNR